jgi:hypothetical protein
MCESRTAAARRRCARFCIHMCAYTITNIDTCAMFHFPSAAAGTQVVGSRDHTFTAVPSHLYYIMCELLKNSCRATAVHAGALGEDGSRRDESVRAGLLLPPVKVIVARGREDMAIKVCCGLTYSKAAVKCDQRYCVYIDTIRSATAARQGHRGERA